MKKLLLVLLALSVFAWLGCGDTMTDQMGTNSANGADLDLTEIITLAAQGYYQIPNALDTLEADTNIYALYGDTEYEGYFQGDGDEAVQVTACLEDELDDDLFFPILGGAIVGELSQGNVIKVWNATTGAFDTKYDFGGTVVASPQRFATQSVLTWFAIDNPNFNSYTSDAQTATQYSTYSFSYTYTAQVSFSQLGQAAVLIIAFADPDGDMNGAVAMQVAATSGYAACALLTPDPITQAYFTTGISDATVTGYTGGAFTTGGAYVSAATNATTGWVKVFTVAGTDAPMYTTINAASTLNLTALNTSHTVQLVISGGTATAGATFKGFVDGVEIVSFSQFGAPYAAAYQAALWSGAWNKALAANTEQAAFMQAFILPSTSPDRTLSPSVSMLASSPTQ